MDDRAISKITLEPALYLLAFGAAMGFRFISLGQAPLGDGESRLALQAMQMAAGVHPPLDPQAGYLTLTSALFFLFGRDGWLARFWPALVGAGLALAPYLFREQIGRSAALALAFFIAFDPGLVAVSRQADGRMLALVFTAFGLGFMLARKPVGAGICAGLALLGGPTVWMGTIGLALGWFIFYALQPAGHEKFADSRVGAYDNGEYPPASSRRWDKMGVWALGTILVVGTLF